MPWKLLLRSLPLLVPLLSAIATPTIDVARQWVIDHPTETIVTSAIAAITNWLAPSPITRVGDIQKTNIANLKR